MKMADAFTQIHSNADASLQIGNASDCKSSHTFERVVDLYSECRGDVARLIEEGAKGS
jgi:hypothetical protein